MESATETLQSYGLNILLTVVLIVGGLVAVYFLYKYLYGAESIGEETCLNTKDILATSPPVNLPDVPSLYEGGDYSVSFWMYVNSYNVNRNRRKHILQIGGPNFASLLIGLGAFKNSLVVRTHSREMGLDVAGTATDSKDASGNSVPSATTPNADEACRGDSSLTPDDLDAMFRPLAMDDAILQVEPECDLPEVNLQRWVNVTVVLSGRTTDVYLDGKLARSCISKSYYKVDPEGVKVKMLERGGFDGHIGTTCVYNKALNPSQIYRIYTSGPFRNASAIF